jgi:hypothetical protein
MGPVKNARHDSLQLWLNLHHHLPQLHLLHLLLPSHQLPQWILLLFLRTTGIPMQIGNTMTTNTATLIRKQRNANIDLERSTGLLVDRFPLPLPHAQSLPVPCTVNGPIGPFNPVTTGKQ